MIFNGLLCSYDQNAVVWIKIIFDGSNSSEENLLYCFKFDLFCCCLVAFCLSMLPRAANTAIDMHVFDI